MKLKSVAALLGLTAALAAGPAFARKKTPPPPGVTPPSAPTLKSAVQAPGSTNVDLEWTLPENTGGEKLTSYLATSYVDGVKGQEYMLLSVTKKAQVPCAGAKSKCGFTIAAVNDAGPGAPSNQIDVDLVAPK